MKILRNEPLAKYTSYRIGGPATVLAFPEQEVDLQFIAGEIRKTNAGYFILGNGSNLLVPDAGFDGWVVRTTELKTELEFLPGNQVRVGAGALNSRVIRACAEKGLAGVEYLAGVPGTIGGAVAMNAGSRHDWIGRNLLEVETFSLATEKKKIFTSTQLKFSYRKQHFFNEDEIVLSVVLQLTPGDPRQITSQIADSIRKRKIAQPIEMPSCGSVFRNPGSKNSWQLIEAAGLRGHKIGGARISEKHANFIVNEGGAKMTDVLELIQLAKTRVKETAGVELEEEVVVLKPRYLK